MQHETNALEDLFGKTTDYLETRAELVRLKAIGKASEMGSSIVSRLIIGIMFLLVLVLLNIGIAIWLGTIVGELYLGFFIVTGFYLLLLIIVYAARKKILKTPVKNLMIKDFLN